MAWVLAACVMLTARESKEQQLNRATRGYCRMLPEFIQPPSM